MKLEWEDLGHGCYRVNIGHVTLVKENSDLDSEGLCHTAVFWADGDFSVRREIQNTATRHADDDEILAAYIDWALEEHRRLAAMEQKLLSDMVSIHKAQVALAIAAKSS